MNDKAVATELTKIAGLIFRPTFLQRRERLQEGEQAKPWKLIEVPKGGQGHPLRPEVVGEFETEREAMREQNKLQEQAVRNDPQSWRRSEFRVNYERAASVASELVKIAKELIGENVENKKELTRVELARMLGGRRFKLRRVSFSDLARGYAYTLEVEGVPSGAMSSAMWEANKDILATIKDIKQNYSFDGTHIL